MLLSNALLPIILINVYFLKFKKYFLLSKILMFVTVMEMLKLVWGLKRRLKLLVFNY